MSTLSKDSAAAARPIPAPINRIPVGLLDFLGLKSMGELPRYMVSALQPTIDLFRFYADANATELALVPSGGGVLNANQDRIAFSIATTTPVDLSVAGNLVVPRLKTGSSLRGMRRGTSTRQRPRRTSRSRLISPRNRSRSRVPSSASPPEQWPRPSGRDGG